MCHIFDKNYKFPKDLKLDVGGFDSEMKEIEINLDKIAQDIRDRKDNAMAMEFTRVIGELLKKNGVSVKITEYQTENHATNKFEMLYGCSIDELDFSEHDKVFEDKIDLLKRNLDLQKDKRCEVETERNYLAERIGQLIDESQELKQRIAELESKKNQLTESILRKETKIHELESNETSELPFDPLECANYLINATYEREASSLERGLKGLPEKVNLDRYTADDLEQIAEHLLVYCKHNKESEENGKSKNQN